ncbi:hypothetical protein KCP69_12580 [Salmonella enterica subsp. enterica]|nr:hypothetical protein KCP69_12580 [Salmonella enterica subsp. enterica]
MLRLARPPRRNGTLHPKTTAKSSVSCTGAVFPTYGAPSLEAGSDYRRWYRRFVMPPECACWATPPRVPFLTLLFRIDGRTPSAGFRMAGKARGRKCVFSDV